MIIMDFSKAFDTVPHNKFLNKLNRYGIRNKTHNWISNFLKYRNKELLLVENTPHGHKSYKVYLKGQYVLGPLYFLTYINDLPNSIRSSIRLFADDCLPYREIKK